MRDQQSHVVPEPGKSHRYRPENGGSLDSGGPTVAGGMIFVNSGYGLYSAQAGNILIAIAPRG